MDVVGLPASELPARSAIDRFRSSSDIVFSKERNARLALQRFDRNLRLVPQWPVFLGGRHGLASGPIG